MTEELDSIEFDKILQQAVAHDGLRSNSHSSDSLGDSKDSLFAHFEPIPFRPTPIQRRRDSIFSESPVSKAIDARSSESASEEPRVGFLSRKDFQSLILLRLGFAFMLLFGTLALHVHCNTTELTRVVSIPLLMSLLMVNTLSISCLLARPRLTLWGTIPYFLFLELLSRTICDRFFIEPISARLVLLTQCIALAFLAERLRNHSSGLLQRTSHRSIADWGFLSMAIAIGCCYYRVFLPVQIDWGSILQLVALSTVCSLFIPAFIRSENPGTRRTIQGVVLIRLAIGLPILWMGWGLSLFSTFGPVFVLVLLEAMAIALAVHAIDSTQRAVTMN